MVTDGQTKDPEDIKEKVNRSSGSTVWTRLGIPVHLGKDSDGTSMSAHLSVPLYPLADMDG